MYRQHVGKSLDDKRMNGHDHDLHTYPVRMDVDNTFENSAQLVWRAAVGMLFSSQDATPRCVLRKMYFQLCDEHF